MRTFFQWLSEDRGMDEEGLRTGLGIYPPQYATGQYPPLYFTPISATAAFMLKTIHKGEHPEIEGSPKHKNTKKHKSKKPHKRKS